MARRHRAETTPRSQRGKVVGSPTERSDIMANTCTYGLPQSDIETLSNLVGMVLRMTDEEREQMIKAGMAIELVRNLKNMAPPT